MKRNNPFYEENFDDFDSFEDFINQFMPDNVPNDDYYDSTLINIFGYETYNKGLNYYKNNRVLEINEERDMICSKVLGSSNDQIYHVTLFQNKKNQIIDFYCSCPYKGNCKHIAATLIKFFNKNEVIQQQKELTNPLKSISSEPIADDKIINLNELMGNKKSLIITGLHDFHNAKKNQRESWKLAFYIYYNDVYYYYANKDNIEKWILKPCMQYIKKDGTLGRVSEKYKPEKITEENNTYETDFLSFLDEDNDYSVSLRLCIDWLIDNNSHINLFFKVGNNFTTVQFQEIKTFSIGFDLKGIDIREQDIRNVVFNLLLKCEIDGYDEKIKISDFKNVIYNLNSLYIVLGNGIIIYKKNISQKIIALFKNIFPKQSVSFNDISSIKDYIKENVESEIDFDFNKNIVRLVNLTPETIIELYEVYNNYTGIRVFFKYKDIEYNSVKYDRSDLILISSENNNELECAYRDISFENNVMAFLRYNLNDELKQENMWIYKTYNFLNKKSLKNFIIDKGMWLIDEGYTVRLEKKKKLSRSSGKMAYRVKSGIDWFEIESGYEDSEGNINNISFEKSDLHNGLIYANGGYVIISKSDINKLKMLNHEGFDKDGLVRISKFNFDAIDILYNDIKNNSDSEIEKIKKIIKGLKNFSKIKDNEIPKDFNAVLRKYQIAGYNWLNFLHGYNLSGCLADDMGLGKTVQTLCFLQKLKEDYNKINVLLVIPVTTISNWENEIKRFTPKLSFVRQFGQNRIKEIDQIEQFDIAITSYHTLLRDIEWLKDIEYDYIILDESQYIKNANTKIAKSVRLLKSKHRLSLTGTPVENNTLELWSQMNFLNPGMLGSIKDFSNKYTYPIEKNKDEEAAERLRKKIFPFVLRRKKEDVLDDLPEKEEIIQYLEMDNKQKNFYNSQKEYYRKNIGEKIDRDGVNNSAIQIFEALLRLRQIALFPQLLDKNFNPTDSCKYNFMEEMVTEIVAENHKVLIFSQFVGVLKILKEYFDDKAIKYSYIDGSTKRRDLEIDKFQNEDEIKLFLLSLKAGAIGINLTAADYVILFDPWWNPAVESQAIDRAHRIGQTKKVLVYKFIVKDSIEEKILALQENKKELVNKLITEEASFFKSLSKNDILHLFE